jgi:Golgi SNAP receptor complex protein 1
LQTKASEIDLLLQRLSEINGNLSGVISDASDPRAHTLARHRDILHDFTQEYRRLSSIAGAARDRAGLLGGSSFSDVNNNSSSSSGLLLRERSILDRSHAAMDGVLGHAQGVASNLTQQRQLFDAIDSKLTAVGARFPVVNSLLNAIRRRKNKDTLVLAGVSAVCLLLILIYWVSK